MSVCARRFHGHEYEGLRIRGIPWFRAGSREGKQGKTTLGRKAPAWLAHLREPPVVGQRTQISRMHGYRFYPQGCPTAAGWEFSLLTLHLRSADSAGCDARVLEYGSRIMEYKGRRGRIGGNSWNLCSLPTRLPSLTAWRGWSIDLGLP